MGVTSTRSVKHIHVCGQKLAQFDKGRPEFFYCSTELFRRGAFGAFIFEQNADDFTQTTAIGFFLTCHNVLLFQQWAMTLRRLKK